MPPPQMSAPGPIRQAWLRWKALRLPWRKRFLVGLDLQGNTFWEFKDQLSSKQGRMRRIVQYPSTVYYSEVSGKLSPAWHQWLRHTRQDPPSLTEQSQDLVRQRNLKILAAQADARWAAKASMLDAPGHSRRQPLPAIGVLDPGDYTNSDVATEQITLRHVGNSTGGEMGISGSNLDSKTVDMIEDADSVEYSTGAQAPGHNELLAQRQERSSATMSTSKKPENPWSKAGGGPSEGWQPAAWNPGAPTSRK